MCIGSYVYLFDSREAVKSGQKVWQRDIGSGAPLQALEGCGNAGCCEGAGCVHGELVIWRQKKSNLS